MKPAVLAERDRILALLRAYADSLKGKALYHPQHDLNALADRIEGTAP